MSNQMSEETARRLAESLEKFAASVPFNNANLINGMEARSKMMESMLMLEKLELLTKIKRASFFTCWYWKKALVKHDLFMAKFYEAEKLRKELIIRFSN